MIFKFLVVFFLLGIWLLLADISFQIERFLASGI